MKIFFITQDDPIYLGEFWHQLFLNRHRLSEIGVKVTAIVLLKPFGEGLIATTMKRVIDPYGLAGSLKLAFHFVKGRIERPPLRRIAHGFGAKFLKNIDIHSDEFLDFARKQDLLVSVAAPVKIKPSLLYAPRLGSVNLHSGALPRYRGMMPVFWQLFDGESRIGVTIHKMNEQLDDGEIVFQSFVDVSNCKTLHEAILTVKRKSVDFFLEFLSRCEEFMSNPKPNDRRLACYRSFPKSRDVKEFKKRTGMNLI